jgi:plastocyanin
MSDQESRPDLTREVRIKVPLPVVIPIGALAVIGLLTYAYSRILLDVPEPVATAIALLTAVNLLGACAFVALRPKITRDQWAELIVVVIYPIVIGLVLTQTGIVDINGSTSSAAASTTGASSSGSIEGGLSITAHNVAFSTKTIAVPASGGTMTFTNQDAVTHDFAIFTDKSATKQLFKSPDAGANATIDFTIPKLKPGSYYFQCDYHPTSMNGTLTVK